MRVIGLTGGIASGKSTVAAMLRELGAEVVDADPIARDVVAPGQPALAEIVAAFGPGMLDADGRLDRRKLADRVFADPAARSRLEAILHPRIVAESERRFADLARRGVEVAVYEAALLVETGRHRSLDGLILVTVPERTQIERLIARDGLEEAEARRRVGAQLPAGQKAAVADYVIECDGPLPAVRRRVEDVWRAVLGRGGSGPPSRRG